MNRPTRWLFRVVAAAVVGCAGGMAAGETCELALKQREQKRAFDGSALQSMLMWVSSQSFFTAPGAERPDVDEQFRKIVKKEPDKYQCKRPFRCVARLGSGQVGMVFDSTDLSKKGYNRLYFDRNGNGDLTDDGVIKATRSDTMPWNNGIHVTFPTLTVPVKAGDSEFEYAFSVTTQTYGPDAGDYVQAELQSLVYREGEITLEGRKRHVYLLDFNSNGRFDDQSKVDTKIQSGDGRIWPSEGDILLVDPEKVPANINWYDATVNESRVYVARIVNIDGKFYDLSVSPAGDRLTLTASKATVGHVVNPNTPFSAIVYGDTGLLRIRGTKGTPVALPEGQWRLLSYTIDLTSASQPASQPATQKTVRKGGLLQRLLLSAIGGEEVFRPQTTMVSASATKDYQAVKVEKGRTVEMPFGPPYKPTARVEEWRRSPDRVELSMVLIGSAGEVCTDLTVKGDRPEGPTFAIVAPDGEIVERGKFEYG